MNRPQGAIRSAGEIRTEPVRKRKGKRLMIWACILFALVAFATINNNWIQVDPFTLPIQGLPQALDGLKIVHLSDIHLPKNAGTLPRLIQLVADQSPDLILITGDWVDRSADVLACGLLEMSEGLAAIAPTYAVTGNHEMENRNPAAWKAVLQKKRRPHH